MVSREFACGKNRESTSISSNVKYGGCDGKSTGAATLPAPDHAKEEPGNVTPPSAEDTPVSVKNLKVKVKAAVKNNTVKLKNIAAVLKKAITKAEKEQGGRIKDLSVEITFDTGKAKKWKNLHLEMDKQAVDLLVKKKVKKLKVNGGSVNFTFDSKTLKKIKKKQSFVLKKGRIRITVSYNASKKKIL